MTSYCMLLLQPAVNLPSPLPRRAPADALSSALRTGAAHVVLVPGDILAAMVTPPGVASACHALTPPSAPHTHANAAFDFIDCSNVADYVSLPALVQAAAPLLSRAAHARLHTESLVAYGRAPGSSPAAFAEAQMPLSLRLCTALLRLRLEGAAELLGAAGAGSSGGVRLTWGPGVGGAPAPCCGGLLDAARLPEDAGGAAAIEAARCCPPAAAAVSSGMLLLELLAACKKRMGPYCAGSATTTPAAAAAAAPPDWAALGGPATIAHLLALAAPEAAEGVLRALLRCGEAASCARLFKWSVRVRVRVLLFSTNLSIVFYN